MSKFTDAIKAGLKAYFETGDTPTEAQFAEWIDAIQNGIEEHQHASAGGAASGTGDAAQIGPTALLITDEAQGDIIYRAAAAWARLAAGTSGKFLKTQGAAANPIWASVAAGFYNAYVCVRDKKAQNTDGGTFTQDAWRTRDITDELADTANICTINANQITLEAGTYTTLIREPAIWVDRHQGRLYNITDTAVLIVGSCSASVADTGGQTDSIIQGRFTLAAQKVLEVQHYCAVTVADWGFGVPKNVTDEIFTVAEFWREI